MSELAARPSVAAPAVSGELLDPRGLATRAAEVAARQRYRHPMAQLLGDGTLSSSDGLRLPTRGKSLTGRALSRYFVHEGLTSYTHVSDQHSTFGTQIIVSTERDATFTLLCRVC